MFQNFKSGLTVLGVLSVMLSVNFFTKPDAAVAGGFTELCKDIQGTLFAGNFVITARCLRSPAGDATRKDAWINLSALLESNPGTGDLIWVENHNVGFESFTQNCEDIEFKENAEGDWVLTAECTTDIGGTLWNGVYPDDVISSQNGDLVYDLNPNLGH